MTSATTDGHQMRTRLTVVSSLQLDNPQTDRCGHRSKCSLSKPGLVQISRLEEEIEGLFIHKGTGHAKQNGVSSRFVPISRTS